MLGRNFRFRVSNTQNQNITVVLTYRPWKFSSTGAITYGSEVTAISSTSVSATTGTTVQTAVDNSTDLNMGADLTISMTAASATNGTGAVFVTLERSTDGGTTWPTAGLGEPVGAYTVTAADSTSARLANYRVD